MAALLRHAARRVGGSVVQRTQAAFTTPAAAGERRLLTTEVKRTQAASITPAAGGERRLPTEVQRTQAASTTPAAGGERCLPTEEWVRRPPKNLQDFPSVIQERKEMLYDKIAFMERITRNNYKNRELLRFLSVQVKPRPEDSLWRWMRASKRMKDAARAAVLVSGCTLCYHVWSLMVEGKWMTQNTKKQVQ